MCNFNLGFYEEVITDATKAIKIDPEYVKAYHRRGKAHLEMGEYKKALKDFKSCVAKQENDKVLLDSLAEAQKHVD